MGAFRTTKAALKMHTLLDLRGNIPSFIHISDGKLHDVNILDQLIPEAGAFCVMHRLSALVSAASGRVTRAKRNMDAQRRYSHPTDRSTGVIFSIGSATMANAGASVMLAAKAVRDRVVELALKRKDAPFAGAEIQDVIVTEGTLALAGKNLNVTYAELLARNELQTVAGNGDYDPVEEAMGPKAIFSFGAVFAEAMVDSDLGTVRLSRVVGAFDAGRIINPKTARSQAIGGIIWGAGQALLEQSETDPATGRFVNRNYSGYLVANQRRHPRARVGEFDEEASPLGAKGLGELTAVSVAPAIANAVYHATGKRIRDLPITIEKLL